MRPLSPLVVFLGIAGVVPFIFLAMAALFWGSLGPIDHIATAALAYGGCVLSFLGAVHWGLALEQPEILPTKGVGSINRKRFLFGVVPALWACAAIYAGMTGWVRHGLLMIVFGYLAVLAVERVAYRRGALPVGYFPFRVLLTVLVVLSLLACLSAPLQIYSV